MGLAQAEIDDNTITVVISCFFILSNIHFTDLTACLDNIETWLQIHDRASSGTGENLAVEIVDRGICSNHHSTMKHLNDRFFLDLPDGCGDELNVDGVAVL